MNPATTSTTTPAAYSGIQRDPKNFPMVSSPDVRERPDSSGRRSLLQQRPYLGRPFKISETA